MNRVNALDLLQGNGVKMDRRQGKKWLKEAIRSGSWEASLIDMIDDLSSIYVSEQTRQSTFIRFKEKCKSSEGVIGNLGKQTDKDVDNIMHLSSLAIKEGNGVDMKLE